MDIFLEKFSVKKQIKCFLHTKNNRKLNSVLRELLFFVTENLIF